MQRFLKNKHRTGIRRPAVTRHAVSWLYYGIPGFMLFILGCGSGKSVYDVSMHIENRRFAAVRFDPSYYYDVDMNVPALCRHLAETWRDNGINAVYVKAYDPTYGAVYKTRYPGNIRTDYGRLNFLKAMIRACHREEIRVFAWIPAFQHKQIWDARPEWREKMPDGSDYRPDSHSYFLCVRNPACRKWWLGFISDLLDHYGDLDGIDLAEPVISWKPGEACHCPLCREAAAGNTDSAGKPEKSRSDALTSLLHETCRLIRRGGKLSSVTSITAAGTTGRLHSPEEQRVRTGFDLDGLLDSPDRPDFINMEILWQQWADFWNDTDTFCPEWTEKAVREVIRQVNHRADLVIHVEMTRFGVVSVPDSSFFQSLYSAMDGGARAVDFYDTRQADDRGLWPQIKKALAYVPVKRVVLFHDAGSLNDAGQLERLLRHFNTETRMLPVDEFSGEADLLHADLVFYIGTVYRPSMPARFVRAVNRFQGTVCWVNENIQALGDPGLAHMGLSYQGVDDTSAYEIVYREERFFKGDSIMHIIGISDSSRCRMMATARSGSREVPYIVRCGRFWYVADLPTSYVTEGGRHIVFAELLHEIVGENHAGKHLALVRIEDVNPTSTPEYLRSIADFLKSRNIPFSVGVTPFYLDPAENTALSLSDRPGLVEALRYMVRSGGTIVLHGCTHQYRGQTAIDYEFWDGMNDTPLPEVPEIYVRDRLEKALDECFANDLYPLVWETPHYAASLSDYAVIDRYFSTCYERRNTVDQLGSDQLLPFLIPSRSGQPVMIPENLGYVPLENPSPETIISHAEKNMVIRDGFASFFFHSFVPVDHLKTIVKGIERLGYTFADIRTLTNRVRASTGVVMSGQGEVRLDVRNQYINDFYMTPRGKRRHEFFSPDVTSEPVHKSIACPPGWQYVAVTRDEKAKSLAAGLWTSFGKMPLGELWQVQPLEAARKPLIPLVLVDSDSGNGIPENTRSHIQALQSVGIQCRTLSVTHFLDIPEDINLLVIPSSAGKRLSEQHILFILRALSRGMNVVLEPGGELAERMGIRKTGDPLPVHVVQDEYYPQVDILWKEPDTYQRFDVPIDYVTYYSEKNTGDPLIIGGEYGEGRYLYLATPLDPTTGLGYGRYPYYCDLIQRQFDLWPLARRESAEIYFEPGDREDVSLEALVGMWKAHGYRTVYVAGWHMYENWSYDYRHLIDLLHQNAMLAYLWLELPYVSRHFWEAHPSWREKTATNQDAVVEWRHHMALTEPACLEAVFSVLSGLIQRYDWDGINLAELCFSSPFGPQRPDLFTPMHSSVRNDFSRLHGFDPILLFQESSPLYWRNNPAAWETFQDYRHDLVVQLHDTCLGFLHRERARKQNDMEIVVTVLDNIHAAQTGLGTATDTKRIIALKDRRPFTIQIEDPFELWHLGPARYDTLSRTYRSLVRDQKDMIFDINVVPSRTFKGSLAPTRQPTGLELYHSLKKAQQKDNRVALYSESSIYMVDLPWIAHAMAQGTRASMSDYRWVIDTDHMIQIDMDGELHRDLMVDDRVWPAYFEGRMLLPSGNHVIRPVSRMKGFQSTLNTPTRLVDITGELTSCRLNHHGIEISYRSEVRNHIVVNERPRKVLVDNTVYPCGVKRGKGGFTVILPAGSHQVRIMTRSTGAMSVRNFSMIASVTIVIISILAGLVLMTLYINHFKRRIQRRTRR